MSLKIGKSAFVSSSPSSAYHKLHGKEVLIIGESEHPSNKEDKVLTFYHPQLGPGSLFEYGLKSNLSDIHHSGFYKIEDSESKPMFSKFVNQKLTTKLGEFEHNGKKIITFLHSSLGFISVFEDELKNNDIYSGER